MESHWEDFVLCHPYEKTIAERQQNNPMDTPQEQIVPWLLQMDISLAYEIEYCYLLPENTAYETQIYGSYDHVLFVYRKIP